MADYLASVPVRNGLRGLRLALAARGEPLQAEQFEALVTTELSVDREVFGSPPSKVVSTIVVVTESREHAERARQLKAARASTAAHGAPAAAVR